MWIYRFKNFLRSRNGRITLFALATASLFVFLAGHLRKRQQAEEEVTSRLPKLPSENLWIDPEDPAESVEGEHYTFSEPNETFRPFRPVSPKLVPEEEPLPPALPPESPSLVGAGFPLAPMIFSERAAKASPQNAPVLLPETTPEPPGLDVEEGALLYCELSAPVSSDQAEGPVLARLTRPLTRRGRMLLPAGASLSGSLQRSSDTRMFFSPDWRVKVPSGAWVAFKAHTQEAAYDATRDQYAASDGRAGLPAPVPPEPKKENAAWRDVLGNVAVAAGRIGQDRTRTALGEFIPGTARNSILQGTSEAIEHSLSRPAQRPEARHKVLQVPAGTRFYLFIAGR